MAIYNVNKTSSPTITQTATRSGGVMRAGGLNLSSLISALSGMSDNQKNRCDIIINDTYSLTQYDSTTYTNSSIQSNGSVISYILDTTTPVFKSRVGSTDTPITVTSWKIIYADDSVSGGNTYPANRVSYDNSGTDLSATNVQDAITELINGGTENIFDGSIEDWNALSTAEKTAYDHVMINNDYSDNPVGNLDALTTTDKSSCVGAINEVNNRTSKLPDFPNAVNISSYTITNYYVAPKDGFIRLQIPPGQSGFGCIYGTRVIGGRNSSTGAATTDNYLVFSTQVRKGCNLALNTLGTASPDVVLEFVAYQA